MKSIHLGLPLELPFLQFKDTVLSALLVEVAFEFIPSPHERSARAAINSGVALNVFRYIEVDRAALLAVQLMIKTLHLFSRENISYKYVIAQISLGENETYYTRMATGRNVSSLRLLNLSQKSCFSMVKTKAQLARVAAKAFRMQSQQSSFPRAMTTRYGLIATGPDFAKLLERLDAAELLQK